MKMLRQTCSFLSHEIRSEWRAPYVLQSTLLYVMCTVMIGYHSFQLIDAQTWNALYWIVMVFVAINSVSRSFLLESRQRAMFYYTLASPHVVLLARLIYNIVFLWLIAMLSAGAFAFFLGDMVENKTYFLLVLFLAALSLGSTFTMISALASRANNSYTMTSVMGFPVVIPQLLLLISQSNASIAGAEISSGSEELVALVAISMMIIILSFLIFPYLWRE